MEDIGSAFSNFRVLLGQLQEVNSHHHQNLEHPEVSSRNKFTEDETKQTIEVLTKIKDEYTASTQLTKNTLQALGLAPNQLSVSTRKQIEDAAQCETFKYCEQHPLNMIIDVSQSALEAAKLARQESALKRRIKVVTENHEKLEKEIVELNREFVMARKECSMLQEEKNKEIQSASICSSKSQRYIRELHQLEADLAIGGVTDEKRYLTILENNEKFKAMKSEIAALRGDIQSYGQLPPDLDKASEILMQAKREHNQLIQQLATKMNSTTIHK